MDRDLGRWLLGRLVSIAEPFLAFAVDIGVTFAYGKARKSHTSRVTDPPTYRFYRFGW